MPELVRDQRGQVPAYVIDGHELRHQPTGLCVRLPSRSAADVRRAQLQLMRLIKRTRHD